MQRRSAKETLAVKKHELLADSKTTHGNSSWKRRLAPAVLITSDILIALLCWHVASVIQRIWGQGEMSEMMAAAMVPILVLWVGVRALLGLYPGYGLDSVEILRRHTYSVLAALAALAVLAVGLQVQHLSRLLLLVMFANLLVVAPFTRHLTAWALERLDLWGNPVVILSYKETGTNMVRVLRSNWNLGYHPIALFDFRLDTTGVLFSEVNHQQALSGIVDLARARGVDTAIFAMPYTRREQLAKLVSQASVDFKHVMVIPNLTGVTNSAVVARNLAGTFAVEIKYNLLDSWALRTKRILDLCLTVVGGTLLIPFLVAIVLLITLDSRGAPFYGHWRIGSEGTPFRCWKFRTMHPNAETLLEDHLRHNPHLKVEWEHVQKLRKDPRVTRVGRFLRKTSLDELPQLWNVLRGQMSLIGPRPIVEAEIAKYEETYELYKRVKPGISGAWQVSGRSDTSYAERVAMDSRYVQDWSVWLDLVLLARTITIVLRGRGAY